MKAWRAETFGKPSDVLKLVDIDVPIPGPGEALLRVLEYRGEKRPTA